jgi:hypothetical protein
MQKYESHKNGKATKTQPNHQDNNPFTYICVYGFVYVQVDDIFVMIHA